MFDDEHNRSSYSHQNHHHHQEQEELDVRCVTFNCPSFIQKSDIPSIPTSVSSRIIHIYGEHEAIPLSLTSISSTYERAGLIVYIKDSKTTSDLQ